MFDSPRSVPPPRRSETPTFSVVIPTHNRASTLPRAIQSVLDQTCPDLELIVVDDGSSDETPDVVRGFDDPRIRSHRFADRRGANAARNAGVDLAFGELISFLDSDDEFHPIHLERVLEVFRTENTECSGVFTSYQLVRGGEVIYVSKPEEGYASYNEMLANNVIGGFPCVTLRASVFENVRPDESLQCWQDYDFFLRLLRRGHRLRGIDETLVSCYQGDVRIGNDLGRTLQGTRRFFEKHSDVLTNRGKSKLHYYRAFSYARSGDFASARSEFLETIRADPTRWLAYPHLLAAFNRWSFQAFIELKRFLRMAAHGTLHHRPGETTPRAE